MCEKGTLKKVVEKHFYLGVSLGTYPGEKCSYCGELWTDSAVMKKIEVAAKQKGVWGLGAKTKITMAGNSLAVRIPKKIADFLKLKSGKEAYVHPEENKLVIETEI